MLTYGILVKDELDYLQKLLPSILEYKHSDDKVIVLIDEIKTPRALQDYLTQFPSVRVESYLFQRDFSAMRNHLKGLCETEWMFQIDCDEIPHKKLTSNLHQFLQDCDVNVDAVSVPRINTYEGMTEEFIEENYLNAVKNDEDWYFWPDYQARICRCKDKINWKGDIHEGLTGFNELISLVAEEENALLHHKSLSRQKSQTEFYRTFENHLKLERQLIDGRKKFQNELETIRKRFGVE